MRLFPQIRLPWGERPASGAEIFKVYQLAVKLLSGPVGSRRLSQRWHLSSQWTDKMQSWPQEWDFMLASTLNTDVWCEFQRQRQQPCVQAICQKGTWPHGLTLCDQSWCWKNSAAFKHNFHAGFTLQVRMLRNGGIGAEEMPLVSCCCVS